MDTSRYIFLRGCFLAVLILLLSSLGSSATDPATSQAVSLRDIEFSPAQISAQAGDLLTFTNNDPFEHDVYIVRTANPNDILFPATTLPSGQSLTVPVQDEGLYTVYCTIHGGMMAKVSTTGSFELSEAQKKAALTAHVLPPIVKTGEELFWGKGQCHQCHQLGDRGEAIRGPDLLDVGLRAGIRAQKLGLESGTAYLVQSIMEPAAHIVPGYTNSMARVYQPPIDLNEDEISAIVTYLQSQGGSVDTWAITINANTRDSLPAMNPFRAGDPEQGKQMFQDAGCPSCHAVGPHAESTVGPELSQIGAYRNWTWLAESVLDPDAEIGANWKNAIVHLKSGEIVSGILRENTDEQVTLRIDSDRVRTFPQEAVGQLEISQQSRMPGDYGEILSFQQMADLLRYLESLRGTAEDTTKE